MSFPTSELHECLKAQIKTVKKTMLRNDNKKRSEKEKLSIISKPFPLGVECVITLGLSTVIKS